MVPQVGQANISGLHTVSDTESICLGHSRNIPSLNVRSYSTSRRRVDVRLPTQAEVKLIIHCPMNEHVNPWHYCYLLHRAIILVDETSGQDDSQKR